VKNRVWGSIWTILGIASVTMGILSAWDTIRSRSFAPTLSSLGWVAWVRHYDLRGELLLILAGILLLLTAVTLFLVFRVIEAKPAFKIFGVFYLGAIIILTVVSVWNFFTYPNVPTALFALGTILFTASDIILILNTFGGEQTYKRRIANLSLYYAGQLLIAFSLLFIKV
jgi:hypothetical protein